ncbi:heme peroxidase, partial [Mycena olivaceomarginata]
FSSFTGKHNVSFGDFIQFAGAVGVNNCPGSPRLEFLAGRANASQPAPSGSVHKPSDPADKIMARFADAGFASHMVPAQDHVDESVCGTPFDSTPGVFDTQFFIVVGSSAAQSPSLLSVLSIARRRYWEWLQSRRSRIPRSRVTYSTLTLAIIHNQNLMATNFRAAMSKMAILGQSRADLTDCSGNPFPVSRRCQAIN